jgi:hypothetical protein
LCYPFGIAPFAILAFLLVPLRALACDCPYWGAPCKAFAATPVIFCGRVTKISQVAIKLGSGEVYQQRIVTFEVEPGYRGLESHAVTQGVSGFSGGDCGYDFLVGVEYLVYAAPHPATGKLYTGICERTRLLSAAADDLEYFSKKDDPDHGAGIEGWIDELSRDRNNNTDVVGPLKHVQLSINGAKHRWTITTGEDGRFRLWGLPPGRYHVTPNFSPKFVPMSRTVDLKSGSCEELRFLATPPRHKISR